MAIKIKTSAGYSLEIEDRLKVVGPLYNFSFKKLGNELLAKNVGKAGRLKIKILIAHVHMPTAIFSSQRLCS